MKLKKFLNAVILITTLVLFWILLSGADYDIIRFFGYLIVIWYNWETYKRLRGIPNRFGIINLIAATVTIVFSLLLLFWTFEMFLRSDTTPAYTGLTNLWGIIHTAYALLIAAFTLMTFKLHRAKQA